MGIDLQQDIEIGGRRCTPAGPCGDRYCGIPRVTYIWSQEISIPWRLASAATEWGYLFTERCFFSWLALLSVPLNAPLFNGGEEETFQITHPFHPLYGESFELVTYRRNWGLDRVSYHDDTGKLCSIPAQWTSVYSPEPFVVISAGRSPFCI